MNSTSSSMTDAEVIGASTGCMVAAGASLVCSGLSLGSGRDRQALRGEWPYADLPR